jgi:predicted ATP-grasp superfamily ATP-dependent carboligase
MLPPLDTSRPALVLGVEHPRGLAVLRSLARAGVSVVVVDRYARAPGLRSRHAARAYLLDTDDYAVTLTFLESLDGLEGAVLIPTNDHYLRLVASSHARLAGRFTLTTPHWDVLEPAVDKTRLFRLAASVPLTTPVFYTPQNARHLDEILATLDFDRHNYIFSVAPTSPEPADLGTVRFTIPAGHDLPSARARGAELLQRTGRPPMIQELIPGEADRCIGVVLLADHECRTIGARAVRRLKLYPYFRAGGHAYGGNVHCESVHDEEAIATASALVARTNLSGVVTVEFRRRPSDGALVLMKIDPRVVGMAGLCAAIGFDVPTLLYRLHTNQRVSVSSSYAEGKGWVWEMPYLLAMLASRSRAWREVPAALSAFWNATAFGVWSAADPSPFAASVAGSVRSQVRKRFLRERARAGWTAIRGAAGSNRVIPTSSNAERRGPR